MTQRDGKKILDFYYAHKRMPSYKEVASLMGYASKNAAFELVAKLIDAGFIQKDHTGKLIPTHLFSEVKLLGAVEAGFPSVAEEQLIDSISIDDFLIEHRDSSYVLTVKGDSMKDAGIMEGDLVIVERREKAKEGSIVIAELDREWTIKYLRKDKSGTQYLEPANDAYPNLYPKESLHVVAVVVGVIRKYRR